MDEKIGLTEMADKPLATFVSRRFLWRDSWNLYTNRLECDASVFGITNRKKLIYLSTLKPLNSHFDRVNQYLFPNLLGLIGVACLVLLFWRLSSRAVYPDFSLWIVDFFVLYALIVAAFACCPDRYIGFTGSPPIYLKYGWWQRKNAIQFGHHVVQQIAKQPGGCILPNSLPSE